MTTIKNTLRVDGHQPREITIKVPDLAMTILAMKSADHVYQSLGMAAGMDEAARCQMRLALVEVDGKKISFTATEGDGLDRLLAHKQRDALASVLARLVEPTGAELEIAEASVKMRAADGVVVYEVTLPGRGAPVPAPAARCVFSLPSRNVERTAKMRAEKLEKRNQMIQFLHTVRERAALCLVSVEHLEAAPAVALDGEQQAAPAVVRTFKAEDGFAALAYWQQALLCNVMESQASATRAEVDDFLSGAALA